MKPTFGRVSRRGVFPLSYALDHCGPLAWSVEDAAIALQAIAGFDPQDPGSADVPVPDFCAKLDVGVKGLRIGLPRDFFRNHPEFIAGDFGRAGGRGADPCSAGRRRRRNQAAGL